MDGVWDDHFISGGQPFLLQVLRLPAGHPAQGRNAQGRDACRRRSHRTPRHRVGGAIRWLTQCHLLTCRRPPGNSGVRRDCAPRS